MSTIYWQSQQEQLRNYVEEVKKGKPIEVGKKISTILEWTLAISVLSCFFAIVCACMSIHAGLYYGGTLGTIEVVWASLTLILFLILLGLFITLWVLYRKFLKRDVQNTRFKWNDKIGECLQSFLVVTKPISQETSLPSTITT